MQCCHYPTRRQVISIQDNYTYMDLIILFLYLSIAVGVADTLLQRTSCSYGQFLSRNWTNYATGRRNCYIKTFALQSPLKRTLFIVPFKGVYHLYIPNTQKFHLAKDVTNNNFIPGVSPPRGWQQTDVVGSRYKQCERVIC